jgi:hypothetical protein
MGIATGDVAFKGGENGVGAGVDVKAVAGVVARPQRLQKFWPG